MERKRKPEQLTRLELEVMKVLWDTGPATVQNVHERLATARPLAYNTVQTVLNILHRKGKVKRSTDARAYLYSPAVSRESAAGQALRDIIDRLFAGNPEDLVLSMVRTRQLTPERLAKIQKLIEEAEGGTHGGDH